MPSPLPSQLQPFFAEAAKPNPSLYFDRGYDGFEPGFQKHFKEGKAHFLKQTCRLLGSEDGKSEFRNLHARRSAALEEIGAKSVDAASSAPLVVGLGRWNATETGFTFDRNTGCPYIPGSTVKGLLLAAAHLVRRGEIGTHDDTSYWTAPVIDRHFGSGATAGQVACRGTLQAFDAYPTSIPTLELGVMTVHYGEYYRDPGPAHPPADWYEPVPVHYLRVKSVTKFRFWFRCEDGEHQPVRRLLLLGLDWLGVGAKKNAGLGWFDTAANAQQAAQAVAAQKVLNEVPMTFEPGTSMLKASQTGLNSAPFATWDKTKIPEHIKKSWKRGKKVHASSITIESIGNAWKIVEVTWKDPT